MRSIKRYPTEDPKTQEEIKQGLSKDAHLERRIKECHENFPEEIKKHNTTVEGGDGTFIYSCLDGNSGRLEFDSPLEGLNHFKEIDHKKEEAEKEKRKPQMLLFEKAERLINALGFLSILSMGVIFIYMLIYLWGMVFGAILYTVNIVQDRIAMKEYLLKEENKVNPRAGKTADELWEMDLINYKRNGGPIPKTPEEYEEEAASYKTK